MYEPKNFDDKHKRKSTVSLSIRRIFMRFYHFKHHRKHGILLILLGLFTCIYIIRQFSQDDYERTLVLDNERHLFIRLFKENDLRRKQHRPFRILSGSLHYFRVLPQQWSDRIDKMKKAGLNTIETYIPWNLHEPTRGHYQFTEGLADLVSFLKLVHQHEMFTIVRPSGYICAEWEWGGLPSWLLQSNDMRVRSTHNGFIQALRDYYSALLPILAEHQYNRHGAGSIIAFQIENEYGSYGQDKNYLETLRSMYVEHGLDEILFTSDNAHHLNRGALNDVWATVNFQRSVKTNIEGLIQFRRNHHLMITEYWTGWFDFWGGKHNTGANSPYTAKELETDLGEIFFNLNYEISINFYMFFGGTNFGFTSGGHYLDRRYKPLVTSYDYDAPLNESGDPTEKYFVIQRIIKKFYDLNPHLIVYNHERVNPDVFNIIEPSSSKKAAYGKISIYGYKTFQQILDDALLSKKYEVYGGPLNMEQFQVRNQTIGSSQGFIVYTYRNLQRILKSNTKCFISVKAVADNAIALVDGKVVRQSLPSENSLRFDLPSDAQNLSIIVENMGRINYGSELDQSRKGILSKVLLNNDIELKHWTIHVLEFRQGTSSVTDWNKLVANSQDNNKVFDLQNGPQLFYAPFHIENANSIRDTYLSFNAQWAKGVAFVNGFNLGRYWTTGPQHTLYIPKELLFKGFNQIQLFELYTYGTYMELVDTPVINA